MKLVEIQELEVGDEVVISCQSYFKYLRILRKPTVGTKTHWKTGVPIYKSVKCSTRRETKTVTWTNHRGNFTREEKTWAFGPEDHNYNQYVDLEYRQIILVKKNND
jgi:alpha-ketoglutarate-dependent taurine dioxygenase